MKKRKKKENKKKKCQPFSIKRELYGMKQKRKEFN